QNIEGPAVPNMKVTILHNAVADSDSAAERDVLVQVAVVENALRSLGHQSVRLPCTLNLEIVEESLTSDRPQLVFNLVESLGGSEFNLSIIAAPDGPRVLPPAEIDFSQFPVGRPKIVGYAAKWDEEAVEYRSTPRLFDFSADDQPLLDRLRAMSLEIWQLFGL